MWVKEAGKDGTHHCQKCYSKVCLNCEARFKPDEDQANVGHEGKDCQTFKSELAKAM